MRITTNYIYFLTFEGYAQTKVEAYRMEIRDKYIQFYSYAGDFLEAHRAKKVIKIEKKNIER